MKSNARNTTTASHIEVFRCAKQKTWKARNLIHVYLIWFGNAQRAVRVTPIWYILRIVGILWIIFHFCLLLAFTIHTTTIIITIKINIIIGCSAFGIVGYMTQCEDIYIYINIWRCVMWIYITYAWYAMYYVMKLTFSFLCHYL